MIRWRGATAFAALAKFRINETLLSPTLNLLVVFNNNPFQIDSKIRSREMKRIELGLRKIGIRVLASGQAGDKLWGCDDLYTQTLLLGCGEDRKEEVCQIVDKEASQARQEVIATSR